MYRVFAAIILTLGFFSFAHSANAVSAAYFFESGPAPRWDKALSEYEKILKLEIAQLKIQENTIEPSSDTLKVALSGGTEISSTVGLPVRQTGTLGETSSRLGKEFVLFIVMFCRWLLHNILAFYGVLVFIAILLFRFFIAIIAILIPKKRVF